MSLWADLRYSARSLVRTPGWTLPLLLTIALGIGTNAAIQGFVRGSIAPRIPLPGVDALVCVFDIDARGEAGPLSYAEYLAIRARADVFESLGAVRESPGRVVLGDAASLLPIAAVTPEVADTLGLELDRGVVVSDRLRRSARVDAGELRGQAIRVADRDTTVAGIAPDWLEGLYRSRPVDVWVQVDDSTAAAAGGTSGRVWVLGRLRAGVSIDRARAALATVRGGAGVLAVEPYTGETPEGAGGVGRIGLLLRAAAALVMVIACANVASFLLSRASARSPATAVRAAFGAPGPRLARQVLADAVLIALAGGASGLLLAAWTVDIVPALLFARDAEQLVFAPDLRGIAAATVVCAGIIAACALLPLLELTRVDPAAVLRRESAGPAPATRRLRAALVLVQTTGCAVLVTSAGLLLHGFHAALRTHAGERLGTAVLATLEARASSSQDADASAGRAYRDAAARTARTVTGGSAAVWMATPPGGRPVWQAVRVDPPPASKRDAWIDVAAFTARTLDEVVLPPVAGRMFRGSDTTGCGVAVVTEEAARTLFAGDAVGRTIEGRAGRRLEIIGVVAMRKEPARTQATIYSLPLEDGGALAPAKAVHFRVPVPAEPARAVLAANVVSPGYFGAMAFERAAGALFDEGATVPSSPDACRVGVVNEEAANLYFGGSAVGAAVVDDTGRRTEIVGVVRPARLRAASAAPAPAIYFPITQDPQSRMTMVIGRARSDRQTLDELGRRLSRLPGGAADRIVVTTLEAHLSRTALAPERIASVLVAASALTALGLGMLGLYGVMTDATRQRRREFAMRLALGASGWRIVGRVLVEGVQMVGAGAAAGTLGSVLVARWIAAVAPDATAPPPWVWAVAPIVLAASAAAASVVPALRAVRTDPLTLLRDA
jgi:hypothetical protein